MSRLVTVFVSLVCLSLTAFADDAKDLAAMQGTWLPESAELSGKPFPDPIRKSIKLVMKDDKYSVTVGKTLDEGTVKLDSAAMPKKMEIKGSEGPNKGKTILAIYEVGGETLKVCYDLSGKEHPAEFKTTEGSLLYLVVYKKEKAADGGK